MKKLILLAIVAILGFATSRAQYFNLTAEEVRIDSRLPIFNHTFDLGTDYLSAADYEVEIVYPQFIDMSKADIARLKAIAHDSLPELPKVNHHLSVERKVGKMDVWLLPLVYREGRYQKMVSFGLNLVRKASRRAAAMRAEGEGRYAPNSVLREGRWAKIRVGESGVHQLTPEVIKKAGFSDLARVKVYGYGGALQPEKLTADYLADTDDLKEIATYATAGRKLFLAQGPVSWQSNGSRVRNTYSNYGYYLITEGDEPLTADSASFVASLYPDGDFNSKQATHALYEVDDYAWFHGGRHLYDSKVIGNGESRDYTLNLRSDDGSGSITIALTADAATSAMVAINDTSFNISISAPGSYDAATLATRTFSLPNIVNGDNKVTITQNGSATMRLDYISMTSSAVVAPPNLTSGQFPTAEYVYGITNQNHHADPIADMVIIIPTTQKQRQQAERLAEYHRTHDGMTVNIVPADELFNEFSSGTPDATAYRRYMKMLYDRAATPEEAPKYLLLFGDGAYDNRMLSAEWSKLSPDDFLLCFESENSLNDVSCFVSDDFFCMLDDEEEIQTGGNYNNCTGKPDVAVGRLPVRNDTEAKLMVDKIIEYGSNPNPGVWQNTVVVMGDDGNNNAHMIDADNVAKVIAATRPALDVKKIMWDAYKMEKSSTGNTFPDARNLITKYMADGALIMNYSGHGGPNQLSHETVLRIGDFSDIQSKTMALWVTAACDILPFDGQQDNIGEAAIFNERGGAIAFYGTTRTVYQLQNSYMNQLFTKFVLSEKDGKAVAIGEAARMAKASLAGMMTEIPADMNYSDLSANKLQYTLLGDPALRLNLPTTALRVDSVNNQAVDNANILTLKAGDKVRMTGSVSDASFDGTLTAVVQGAEEKVICRLQNTSSDGAETAFEFLDRPSTIYKGQNTIDNGRFAFEFVVPKDISYNDGEGRIVLFANSKDGTRQINGESGGVVFNGTGDLPLDSIGPSVFCYLNTPSFTNGDKVNPSPYFMAEIYDESGINATGTGIGHDMTLVIDGSTAMTYNLNDSFSFDYGSYQSGKVGFQIPTLASGKHKLQFRSWDVFNNSSVAELSFVVDDKAAPGVYDISATDNPVHSTTTFIVTHDRAGAQLDVEIEIFDLSGRKVAMAKTNETASGNTTLVTWDACSVGGSAVNTGVYLYRARITTAEGMYTSKAKKLIVLSNK